MILAQPKNGAYRNFAKRVQRPEGRLSLHTPGKWTLGRRPQNLVAEIPILSRASSTAFLN